jgi:hypothetical protein
MAIGGARGCGRTFQLSRWRRFVVELAYGRNGDRFGLDGVDAMTAATHVVKGRLVGPTTVELCEPLSTTAGDSEVDVVVRLPPPAEGSRLSALVKHFQSLTPGTRTKEEIDRQIQQERDSWE